MTKSRALDWLVGIIVIGAATAFPAGIGLAYYYNDATYLIISTVAFIFFMAG